MNYQIPEQVLQFVEERVKAREKQDWALADKLKNNIQGSGYRVWDVKEGTILSQRFSPGVLISKQFGRVL